MSVVVMAILSLRVVKHLFSNQATVGSDLATDSSHFAVHVYHLIQTIAFVVMATLIMRLKLFLSPQLAVLAGLLPAQLRTAGLSVSAPHLTHCLLCHTSLTASPHVPHLTHCLMCHTSLTASPHVPHLTHCLMCHTSLTASCSTPHSLPHVVHSVQRARYRLAVGLLLLLCSLKGFHNFHLQHVSSFLLPLPTVCVCVCVCVCGRV